MNAIGVPKILAASILYGSAALLLSACVSYQPSGTQGTGPNVPVEDRSPSTTSTQTYPGTTAAPSTTTPPDSATGGKADVTLALLDKSDAALRTGDTQRAVTYIERAIRINPRRADLWVQLARLQLHLGDAQVAQGYAQKAITLAGARLDWVRDAWLVIADAKQAQGKTNEADAIRHRWRTAQG